jgi:hypothetical protein
MSRWHSGEAEIERLLAGGEIQTVTAAAAIGEQVPLPCARRSVPRRPPTYGYPSSSRWVVRRYLRRSCAP